MTLEKLALKLMVHYHANLIDVHNALHALGVKSDEQAEEFNKKHVMAIINAYERRGYKLPELESE